jgi:DNA-binding MarR family transcriptional regulator
LNPRAIQERATRSVGEQTLTERGSAHTAAFEYLHGGPKAVAAEAAEKPSRHLLDLQKLETFLVVATTRNFTRAAIVLGYSQSSVTMHVKAIEKELGVLLFERHRFSRDVVLTESGYRTVEYAKRLLALADEAMVAVGKKGKADTSLRSVREA